MKSKFKTIRCLGLFFLLVSLPHCSLDQMASDSRIRPFQESPVFTDKSSARLPVPGTVARGQLQEDDLLYRGEIDGKVVDRYPFRLSATDLRRGQERFDIHCAPCHGRTGLGNGMIVQRGFTSPPSYLDPRLLGAPAGHFVQVITNGFGAMYPYGDVVEVHDRWRIAAYIRALQLSHQFRVDEVPFSLRVELERGR